MADNKDKILEVVVVDIEQDDNSDDTIFKKAAEAQQLFKNDMLGLTGEDDGVGDMIVKDPETQPLIDVDDPNFRGNPDKLISTPLSEQENVFISKTPDNTPSITPTLHTYINSALLSSKIDSSCYSRQHDQTKLIRDGIFHKANKDPNKKEYDYKIDSDTGLKIHNDWTKENCDTVKKWKRDIQKSSFIYETTKEKNNDQFQKVSNWSLVLNTIKLTVSAILAALLGIAPNNTNVIWVGFCVSIFLFIVSGISTYLTGTVSIHKWDQRVNNMSSFIQKLDSFYSVVSLQMNLSDKLRCNANEFITKNAEQYLQILQQSPDVKASEYFEANELFKKYEDDRTTTNYKCSQKYTV